MDNTLSSLVILIVFAVFYVPFVWGLYTINKKLGEKNPWLSFFPILQYYSIVKASGKSLWWLLWMPLIGIGVYLLFIIIFGIIMAVIYMGSSDIMLIGESIFDYFMDHILMGIILVIILYILLLTAINTGYIIVLHAISKRVNRGFWTTFGFFFIPFIMFPIVAYKLKKSTSTTDISEIKTTEKTIEL